MNTRCIKNQSNEFISIYFEKHGGKVMAKDKDASKNKESFFQGVKSEMEKQVGLRKKNFLNILSL